MVLKRYVAVGLAFICASVVLAQDSPTLTLSPSVQAIASPEKAAIIGILDLYLNGFSAGDAESLSRTLHPEAIATGGIGGAYVERMPYAKLLGIFRTTPAAAGRTRSKSNRTVTDLFLHGDIAAAMVAEEYLPPSSAAGIKTFNCFQMYRSGGAWKILNVVNYNDRYEGQAGDRILNLMGLRPGMIVGEIGAGNGRYTFPLARRVGGGGKVYANDIDPKPLDALRVLCKKSGIGNIEVVAGKVDNPMFPERALDLAIMVLVYHHLDMAVPLLKNLKLSLKPGATVVILDPAYDRTGEKDSDRPTTRERVVAEAEEAGYDLITMDASLPRDNIFILGVKGDETRRAPKPLAASTEQAAARSEKAAILDTIDTWWKGHDTDDAALLEKVLHPDTRSWFEEEGKLQFMPYSRDIERIKSGNRRPARDRSGEKRTVVDFAQKGAVSLATMLVESPIKPAGVFRSFTTFQLYQADGRWMIVNLTGFNEPVRAAR